MIIRDLKSEDFDAVNNLFCSYILYMPNNAPIYTEK